MKQSLRTSVFAFATLLLSASAFAQTTYTRVTVRQLNEYPNPITDITQIPTHPLSGTANKVEFTAIVSSYPKNSGLASVVANTTPPAIGRLHVFVTDTTAASAGRDYMSIQIVEEYGATAFGDVLEGLELGDVATFRGNTTFFNGTVQFNVDQIELVTVPDPSRFYPLLNPVEITLNEVIALDEQGQWIPNLANYGKYSGMYVKIKDATSVGRVLSTNNRPYFAVSQNGRRIYTNDISLRYRNDRAIYKNGFNRRRSTEEANGEGNYVPPADGSLIDISGYLWFGSRFPNEASPSTQTFRIVPMDDGIQWTGDTKKVSGQTYDGEEFFWPNDLVVKGVPPGFSGYTQNTVSPRSTDKVSFSVTVLPEGDGITLTKVELLYTVGTGVEQSVDLTGVNNVYSYEFPTFPSGTSVTFSIKATASNGLAGVYGPVSFVVSDLVSTIEFIQRTSNGLRGPSPLVGSSRYVSNITATVVADSLDGIVIVHQTAAAWNGIVLAPTPDVRKLRKGDVIRIDTFSVGETRTDADGITRLDNVKFTKTGENSQYAALIPVITPALAKVNPSQGEAYEGMVVKLEYVTVVNRQADFGSDFGEFEVAFTERPDTVAMDYLNAGFRINEDLPSSTIRTGASSALMPIQLNENLRLGASFASITGFYFTGFGNPKMVPLGGLKGMVGTNYTYPTRTITGVQVPAEVTIAANDIVINWTAAIDYDGGSPVYRFMATYKDDVNFETPVIVATADMVDGVFLNRATLNVEEVRSTLDKIGVGPGQSADLIWTVYVDDNMNGMPVQASTYATTTTGNLGLFTPAKWDIKMTRDATVDSEKDAKFEFSLSQNYPNPFNPSTSIKYSVPVAGQVKLSVYDMLGRLVAAPVNQTVAAGVYNVNFDASKLSSGIYLYRLEQGNSVLTRKMILVK